jgi:hypothetical protein
MPPRTKVHVALATVKTAKAQLLKVKVTEEADSVAHVVVAQDARSRLLRSFRSTSTSLSNI